MFSASQTEDDRIEGLLPWVLEEIIPKVKGLADGDKARPMIALKLSG